MVWCGHGPTHEMRACHTHTHYKQTIRMGKEFLWRRWEHCQLRQIYYLYLFNYGEADCQKQLRERKERWLEYTQYTGRELWIWNEGTMNGRIVLHRNEWFNYEIQRWWMALSGVKAYYLSNAMFTLRRTLYAVCIAANRRTHSTAIPT